MFESTIILDRQELLGWASAGTLTGTLDSPSGDTFNWEFISARDRQLARRDIAISNAVADVAAMISTVWGGKVEYSAPPEPSGVDIPGEMTPVVNVLGTVSHVVPSSTPDKAYPVDDDLLQRDLILLKGLANVAEWVPDAVISGTLPVVVNDLTVAWSLADGLATDVTINPILPLSVDTVKDPDVALAERDNQLALNIAQLRQILRNPFETATRLVVKSTTDYHEPESYVLVFEDASLKIWQAEPGLEGRMRVIYYKESQTISWVDENTRAPLFYVQPYGAGVVSGTTAGPAEFLPYLESRKDCEFWHQKSQQVVTQSMREVQAIHVTNPGLNTIGEVFEDRGSAIFIRPGSITSMLSDGTLQAGLVRVSVLFTPMAEISVDGAKGSGGDTGDSFYTDFPPSGGAISWDLKLPEGPWSMTVYYSNEDGDPALVWPFLVTLGDRVISNLSLKVPSTNGVIEKVDYYMSAIGGSETLTLSWAPTDSSNKLRIHRITFTRESTRQTYNLTARLGPVVDGALDSGVGPETAEVDSYPYRPDSLSFVFGLEENVDNPGLELTWNPIGGTVTPLNISQIELMSFEYPTLTKNADGFDGWQGEMAERAAESVIESFREGVRVDPTFEPTELLDNIRYWTQDSTRKWKELLETLEPRFDQAFRTGGPADIGRPALVPRGIQFDLTNSITPRATTFDAEIKGTLSPLRAVSTLPGTLCYPRLEAFQPWMTMLGLPVMREGFWGETRAKMKVLPLTLTNDPIDGSGGTSTGSGVYPYGSTVNIIATPDPTITVVDVGVDLVAVVDTSGSMEDSWPYIPDLLTSLDQKLRDVGIGSASVHNRYGLIGQSDSKTPEDLPLYELWPGNVVEHMMGGAGQYWTTIDPNDPSAGMAPLIDAATNRLAGTYRAYGMTTEDMYAGIDAAIRHRSWRSNVAKVIIFFTDEDRNYPTYRGPGILAEYNNGVQYPDYDWEAQRAAILAQIATWGGAVHGATSAEIFNGDDVQALGKDYTGRAYMADGSGGYTLSTGGYAQSVVNTTGPDVTSGVNRIPSTDVQDYHDMLMTMPLSSCWSYGQFRAGGSGQQSFTNALVDVMKSSILTQIMWQFDGWFNSDDSLYSSNASETIVLRRPLALKAKFHNNIIYG